MAGDGVPSGYPLLTGRDRWERQTIMVEFLVTGVYGGSSSISRVGPVPQEYYINDILRAEHGVYIDGAWSHNVLERC